MDSPIKRRINELISDKSRLEAQREAVEATYSHRLEEFDTAIEASEGRDIKRLKRECVEELIEAEKAMYQEINKKQKLLVSVSLDLPLISMVAVEHKLIIQGYFPKREELRWGNG